MRSEIDNNIQLIPSQIRLWGDQKRTDIYWGLNIKNYEFYPNYYTAPQLNVKRRATGTIKGNKLVELKSLKGLPQSSSLFWLYEMKEENQITNFSDWTIMARAKIVYPFRYEIIP